MKRSSKMKPSMFLDLLFFRNQDDTKISLNSHAATCRIRYGKKIKKQSIHDRFTDKAVSFVRSLVDDKLKDQVTSDIYNIPHFKSIKIKDSTRFQIPDHLKEHYPGSGGAASNAGVHIQFEYDLLNGKINDLNVTDAKRQDYTDAMDTIDSIEKGDLIIRDMGYFDQKVFNHIDEKAAYYISRVKPKLTLYEEGKEVDMKELLSEMNKKGLQQKEMFVTTNKIKKPIRLLIEVMPQEVVEERLVKAKKEAKKKGRQLSEKYKAYASLNLFITNVDKEILSSEQLRNLYRLRWQIELRFKAWKSYCQVHKVKKMNRYRFECYLYVKLLYILIHWQMVSGFLGISWKSVRKIISINKFYSLSVEHIHALRENIRKGTDSIKHHFEILYMTCRDGLVLESKKHRLGTEDIILLFLEKHANK